jgi:SAM-dependent methyltransferase
VLLGAVDWDDGRVSGIYDSPWAYELACSFRIVPDEVDALLDWCARHREPTRPVRSMLELAAGPAEHAREFARRGIAVTALDLNPAMCRYAADRAKAAGVELEVVRADMTAFDLGRRFDLIVTMLDSTAHLMTLDAFVAHLDRAAAHLADGGLYILEMSHPTDRLTEDQRVTTSWAFEHDGVRGTVRWGEPQDRIDPITQIVDDHVTITVHRGGDTQVIQGVVPYRFWTATELEAAVKLSGALTMVAQYGDFDSVPLSAPDAWRMITVFHRSGG